MNNYYFLNYIFINFDENSVVWEVGPGLGAMTNEILERGANLTVFEIDRGFASLINQFFDDYSQKDKFDYIKIDTKDLLLVNFNINSETKKELVAKDPTYQIASVNTDKVIDEDYNFKSFEELEAGSVVYGTLIPGVNCLCVESLFSFNPR